MKKLKNECMKDFKGNPIYDQAKNKVLLSDILSNCIATYNTKDGIENLRAYKVGQKVIDLEEDKEIELNDKEVETIKSALLMLHGQSGDQKTMYGSLINGQIMELLGDTI